MQLILDNIREIKTELMHKIEKTDHELKSLSETLNRVMILYIENKNNTDNIKERFDSHVLEHKESKKAISTPILNWIFGGGLFALILAIFKYFWRI